MEKGIEILKKALPDIPNKPGVYRMIGRDDAVLYVGKAKNLRKRLESYARGSWHSAYIHLMIAQLVRIDITIVAKEADALLLEAGLIGELSPRYNVLLRSDKSFPYIFIATKSHSFPRLTTYRGTRKKDQDGIYFGPFTNQAGLRQSIEVLEKTFLLRSCADHVFKNRSRPCILYQLQRCSAPCVGNISQQAYMQLLQQAQKFFHGENKNLRATWKEAMKQAIQAQNFKQAAFYRDRLLALEKIATSAGHIAPHTFDQADVFACVVDETQISIQVFFFRSSRNLGNLSYILKRTSGMKPDEILASFIPQFYRKHTPPKLILTHSLSPEDKQLIEETFKLKIHLSKRGEKKEFIDLAMANAQQELEKKIDNHTLLKRMANFFNLPTDFPQRIEIYDNSHIQGTLPVGAMVVYTPYGFNKSEYRIFNVRSDCRGNDLAMMEEVFKRRFLRKETLPDLILVDGGATQLKAACYSLDRLGLNIPIISMAKGKERRAGKERFFLPDGTILTLEYRAPLMHFLQRLRDEAHRFSISSHRRRRLRGK